MRRQIELIDPTDEQLCRRYAEYRASLRSGSERDHGEAAPETTSRNAFATVLAIC